MEIEGSVWLHGMICIRYSMSYVYYRISGCVSCMIFSYHHTGGLWEPHQVSNTPQDQILKWSKYTYELYKDLYTSVHASDAGIQQLYVHNLFSRESEDPYWKDVPSFYRRLQRDDLIGMGICQKYVSGFMFLSYVAEPRYFLHWMENQLKRDGVEFKQQKLTPDDVKSLVSSDTFDAVVMCTGLGSMELLDDKEMYPIRGQVLKVKAPWMKSSWTFDDIYYLIPNKDLLVVGGTEDEHQWGTTAMLQDSENIVNGVCEAFPALRDAYVEHTMVGLRPCRSSVRLESTTCTPDSSAAISSGMTDLNISGDSKIVLSSAKRPLVVYCYGVGGCGFTIGPGLAHDAVENHIKPHLYPEA